MGEPSLDGLWASASGADARFDPDRIADRPRPVRRYLEHALAAGTPLSRAVRLRMHGEIRLGGWSRFRAEQVIHRDRGAIWRATVRKWGLPIRGFDRLVDGEGELRWKLLGVLPVMSASGPDITRSAAGRMAAELIWLPSVLAGPDVEWSASGDPAGPGRSRCRVALELAGEPLELELDVDGDGRPRTVRLRRWGDPDGRGFRHEDFGGVLEEERTFEGTTIPARVRVGWHLGDERFEADGEFFRATIEDARFR